MRFAGAFFSRSSLLLKAFVAGLCFCISPMTAVAQNVPEIDGQTNEPSPDTIVVTGALDREPVKEAREFAKSLLGGYHSYDVGARFNVPVCLAVHGVSDAVVKGISKRFYENARSFGLNVGAKNCEKNVFIGFVDNLPEEVENLLENDRWAFGNLKPSERKKLIDQSGPTRAWHVSRLGNANGIELVYVESSVIPGLYLFEDRTTTGHSRLHSSQTLLMNASVVLIERSNALGKTVRQLADFATMRAIAPVDISLDTSDKKPETILALFESTSAPDELTVFDTAFLKAYYASNGRNFYLTSTIQAIALEFSRKLDASDKVSEESQNALAGGDR